MKADFFQSCGHCWVFQICWHIECNTFTASSFRIWNSSTGIQSNLESESTVVDARSQGVEDWGGELGSEYLTETEFQFKKVKHSLLLLSHFSRVRLFVTPIDGSLPGSPVPGILQAKTLEWVAISSPMHASEKWKWSRSVVSDSLQPHGLQPTRLLHPWDFPGKRTGVGCHRLLRKHSLRRWNCTATQTHLIQLNCAVK